METLLVFALVWTRLETTVCEPSAMFVQPLSMRFNVYAGHLLRRFKQTWRPSAAISKFCKMMENSSLTRRLGISYFSVNLNAQFSRSSLRAWNKKNDKTNHAAISFIDQFKDQYKLSYIFPGIRFKGWQLAHNGLEIANS